MANNRNRNRSKKKAFEDNYVPPFSANQLVESVDTLGLKENTLELIKGAGLLTVLDLVKRTDSDFFRIMRFNKKNLMDVKAQLQKKNLFLKPQPDPTPQAPAEGGAPAPNEARAERPESRDGRRNPERAQERRGNERNAVGGAPRGRERGESQREAFGAGGSPRGNAKGGKKAFGDDLSEKKTKELKEKSRPPKTHPEVVQDIYVKVNKGGKWGFSDRKGKITVQPIYDEVYTFKEELCCVETEDRAGYIDRNGEVVIEPQYECASSFSEGYACVFKGGKCGYINKVNEVVVDFLYDAGTAFENGSCRVKKDGKWGELYFAEREDGSKSVEVRWIV